MPDRPTQKVKFFTIFGLVIGILGLIGTGCSKKEPRYPEDHARFQRLVEALNTLERAYVNQDSAAIHELLLPLEVLEVFEANVQKDFAEFSVVDIVLNIDRVAIEGDHISTFISWQGSWQRSIDSPPTQAQGHGVLLWSGRQVILLRGVEGELPFGVSKRPDFSS